MGELRCAAITATVHGVSLESHMKEEGYIMTAKLALLKVAAFELCWQNKKVLDAFTNLVPTECSLRLFGWSGVD